MNTHYPQISPISKFAIYGLYGDRDIVIPFPYPRKILVSENGWGKTTALNTLYAVLTGRFFKNLERLPFNQIQVTFDNGSVSISKADLESLQSDELRKDKYSTFAQQLRESFPIEVLYFTTYRQIEESLQNLGYRPTNLQLPSGLIQSRMDHEHFKMQRIDGIAARTPTFLRTVAGRIYGGL